MWQIKWYVRLSSTNQPKHGLYFNQSNWSICNLYRSNNKWSQFFTNQIKGSGQLQQIKLHTCKILVKGLTFPYGEHVFKHIRKLNPYFFSSSLKQKVKINIFSLRNPRLNQIWTQPLQNSSQCSLNVLQIKNGVLHNFLK